MAILAVAALAAVTDVSLVIWLAALLATVQVAYLIAIALLFRRARAGIPDVTLQPHAARGDLLARIDALDRALARCKQDSVVPPRAARELNGLLGEARDELDTEVKDAGNAAEFQVETVRTMLRRLRRSLTQKLMYKL